MIKGIENLSGEQKELMKKINESHTEMVGRDYKAEMRITETWVNKKGVVCVRLKNGDWYHYLNDGTWY